MARKFRSKEKQKKQGRRGYERSEVRVNGRIVKWEKERKSEDGRAIGVVHVGAIYVSMKVRWDLFWLYIFVVSFGRHTVIGTCCYITMNRGCSRIRQ
jgi:hypothetical protein